MRAGFRQSHKAMARQTRSGRRAAINHLKKTVGGMRQEFAEDLAGARRAWHGPSPAELQAKAEAERRAKAEAEQQAKEAAERERLAAQARAKEEASRPQASQSKAEAGRPGKKKS